MNTNEKLIIRPSQQEVGYTPLSATIGQGCANCRWHERGACAIIENYPVDIEPTGWCNRWESLTDAMQARLTDEEVAEEVEAVPAPEVEPEAVGAAALPPDAPETPEDEEEDPDEGEGKGVFARLGKMLTRALLRKDSGLIAFKSIGNNHWLGVFTNNFQDKEGEWFSERAIDAYIQRVDTGIVPPPELWLYHVPGSRLGQAGMVGRVGHFVLAMGEYDNTGAAQRAKAYFMKPRRKWRMSHGFTFDEDEFRDGVYHQFNTFEISVLPAEVAANPFTTFEDVTTMKMLDESKLRVLREVLQDEADSVIASLEGASKALEESGINFKDFADANSSSETTAVKVAAAAVADNIKSLLADTLEGQGEVLQASLAAIGMARKQETVALDLQGALGALREEIAVLRAELANVRAELALTPRGSQALGGEEEEDRPVDMEEVEKQLKAKAKLRPEDNPQQAGFNPFPSVKS